MLKSKLVAALVFAAALFGSLVPGLASERPPAAACPVLRGSFDCPEKWNDGPGKLNIEISQTKRGSVTTYQYLYHFSKQGDKRSKTLASPVVGTKNPGSPGPICFCRNDVLFCEVLSHPGKEDHATNYYFVNKKGDYVAGGIGQQPILCERR